MKINENLFWSKVDQTSNKNGCWIWTRAKFWDGYGNYSGFRSHRVSWTLINGSIPEGLFVLHTCDNPPCVNPDHLFLGTQADNNKDKAQKGRCATKHKPHKKPKPYVYKTEKSLDKRFLKKLEPMADQVEQSYLSGMSLAELGKIHGCSPSTVSSLLKNRGVIRRRKGPRGNNGTA